MGITDFFLDMMSYLPSLQEVHAEAPAEEKEDESKDVGGSEEKNDVGEEADEDNATGDDGEEKEEGEEEDEEEDEEEEIVDPKIKLEEDCAKSAGCIGYKHHYDECVERVTAQHEDDNYKGPNEDCVEEFFHLQHCATQCAAPKLFKILK